MLLRFTSAVALAVALHAAEPAPTAHQLPDSADAAWEAVLKAQVPPNPPADWNSRTVTDEERASFRLETARVAAKSADLAKEFATRFPDHAKAGLALQYQRELLNAAVQLGLKERQPDLDAIGGSGPGAEKRASDDSSAASDAKFDARFQAIMESVRKKIDADPTGAFREYAAAVVKLSEEFPNHPQIAASLMEATSFLPVEEARPLLVRVSRNRAFPPQQRLRAYDQLESLARIGQPLDIKFKALDGRDIDFANLKGKVVLIDFWATWCGPCRQTMPELIALHSQFHEKGLELIGLSADDNREALVTYVKKQSIPWPQHFEEGGGPNRFHAQFGIEAIPTLWLVDRRGNLRDISARMDLERKVKDLLAEN
jgi:thiol-disulfide isomerase/thioredoxin